MPQRTGERSRVAAEDMPHTGASRRDRDADAAERLRTVRERLEATVSGLGELDYLRQRQEALVRAALELRGEAEEQQQQQQPPPPEDEEEEEEEERRRREEKLLEENILLLRKQLNCLRRRDAGLLTQLQELDRQISDLRLDTEASHDPLEPDSRPSSGFYELSDAASGSLSNSSNSVFSECFCSLADADGRLPSTDELASCLECDGLVGGLCDDSPLFGAVRRSLSAPHPSASDPAAAAAATSDSQSKYHCDLLARNGSDVYRYPSPLHAVAVQSPILLQMLASHSKDEAKGGETAEKKTESPPFPAPLVPQSSSWPAPNSSSSSLAPSSQTPPHKRLDSYIYSLLQRRAQPIRTSKPRTSISTDPSKSILRQASLCVRQAPAGLGTLRGSDTKPSWVGGAEDAAASSPQRQCSVDSKGEDQEPALNGLLGAGGDGLQSGLTSDLAPNQNASPQNRSGQNVCSGASKDINPSTNSLLKKACKGRAVSAGTLPKDFRELARPEANSFPKETRHPDQDAPVKMPPGPKTQVSTPKDSPKLQRGQAEKVRQAGLELASMGSSSQSQDEGGGDGHMVSAKYIPAKQQNVKVRKGGSKNVKTAKVKSWTSEHNEAERRGNRSQHRSGSKILKVLEDGGSHHVSVSKRTVGGGGGQGASSSKVKRLHASIPEGRVLDKHATSTLGSVRSGSSRQHHHGNHHSHHHHHHHSGSHHHHGHSHHHHHHHHHHGRDQVVVVAKPKYKRNDYRRLRAIMEVPYDEAFRRAQRRQRKELLSAAKMFPQTGVPLGSPYSYAAGSDSEYSAECASLFHSTIVDTSEDERSNYTTNCFGDSESSEEEYVEESTTTTSDTEESGGGGAGGGWGQLGAPGARAMGQEMTQAQAKAVVKIKASHNLKKRILRFGSGSLKLMTTV